MQFWLCQIPGEQIGQELVALFWPILISKENVTIFCWLGYFRSTFRVCNPWNEPFLSIRYMDGHFGSWVWPLFTVCFQRFICGQGILMEEGHLEIPNFEIVPVLRISKHPDQISTTSPSYHRVLFHRNLLLVIVLPGWGVRKRVGLAGRRVAAAPDPTLVDVRLT